MKTNEILLIALTELREVVPALARGKSVVIGERYYASRYGICCNAAEYILQMCQCRDAAEKVERALNDLMQRWPGASLKDRDYPVDGQNEYHYGSEFRLLWQNPKRIELLNWLIKTLTEELENENCR